MDKKRTVFLDRDGTLCRDVGYPAHWSQVHVYPYAFKAVRRLREAGLAVVVITSQSGIGRGFFAEADLTALHHEFAAAFARRGAALDALYHCPHYTPRAGEGGCPCGKPNPGLALRAAADLDLERRGVRPAHVAADLAGAAGWIYDRERRVSGCPGDAVSGSRTHR